MTFNTFAFGFKTTLPGHVLTIVGRFLLSCHSFSKGVHFQVPKYNSKMLLVL